MVERPFFPPPPLSPSWIWLIRYWYFASNGSLKHKQLLSIMLYSPPFCLIRPTNAFVFPDPVPPVNNILYEWSGNRGQFKLYLLNFSFVTSSWDNLFCIFFIILSHLVFFFFVYYFFIYSIYIWLYWIHWFYFFIIVRTQYNPINFFSSYIMPFSSKSLDFNINLFIFMNSVWFSRRLSKSSLYFLVSLFHFQIELLLNNVYNLQI